MLVNDIKSFDFGHLEKCPFGQCPSTFEMLPRPLPIRHDSVHIILIHRTLLVIYLLKLDIFLHYFMKTVLKSLQLLLKIKTIYLHGKLAAW
jgi:hypothetical protein